MFNSHLVAVRLRRKRISIAVFRNVQLEYARHRHIPTATAQARATAEGYLAWAIAQFRPDLLAVEEVTSHKRERVRTLTDAVVRTCANAGVPVWSVSKQQLINAFAEPPPKTRKELRAIAAKMWPTLNSRGHHPLDLETAALGLYVTIERLFDLGKQTPN